MQFSTENKQQFKKKCNLKNCSVLKPVLFHMFLFHRENGENYWTRPYICLTFKWGNYCNSDMMKWEDIRFHCSTLQSNREPLPYVTWLHHALTGAAVSHRLKLIEYPYLPLNPSFLWWNETRAGWNSSTFVFTHRHFQTNCNTHTYCTLLHRTKLVFRYSRWTITRPPILYCTTVKSSCLSC